MYKQISKFNQKELIGKKVSFMYGPGEHPSLEFNDNVGIIEEIEENKFGTTAKVLMIKGEETGMFEWISGVHVDWAGKKGIGSYLHK